MAKLKLSDLETIKDKTKKEMALTEEETSARVTIHMGTCGIAAGGREVMATLMESLEEEKIEDVAISTTGCAGLCSQEPMATIETKGKPPVKYVDLDKIKIKEVVKEHLKEGKVVEKYALAKGSERAH